MEDVQNKALSNNNIRSLAYFFSVQLDQRLAQLTQNTPYQKMRGSDTRAFVIATRSPKTISEIARHLHISRQSTQSSVSRLAKFGLVKLAQHPSNNREKLVEITQQGWAASAVAVNNLRLVEEDIERLVGASQYAALRQGLEDLVQKMA